MTAFVTVLLVAISLAMDAMAVSVTNGIKLKCCTVKDGLKMGIFFGIFQFIMPLLGFYLGNSVVSFIGKFAPYLAFVILAFLGGRMIWEANKCDEECFDECKCEKLGTGELFIQAIATSIDALAVGLSLAIAVEHDVYYVYYASAIIGIVAFVLSFIGALAGRKLGQLFERWAETMGGIVLVLIGAKILLEYLLK
ncbi:MAG: manganese efflux pump MntP family protein [Bacillota bacterium]|nr:manganese efflux pump MntP family protein [Bacillota bacterium]